MNGEVSEGKVFVFLGSAVLAGEQLTTDAWSYEMNEASAELGYCVTGIGDVNDDGYSDFAVSARYYNGTGTHVGRVLVFYGSSTGPAGVPDRTLTGTVNNGLFGNSMAALGDGNADGYDDLPIRLFANGASRGEVYVYNGSSTGIGATRTSNLYFDDYSGFGILK